MKITAETFIAVKTMLNNGATYADVNKYFGVSSSTAKFIRKANDYDGYRNIIKGIVAKQHERRVAKNVTKPAVTEPATEPAVTKVIEHKSVSVPWTVLQEMQKTNELLTLISNKLAFIVEQLA